MLTLVGCDASPPPDAADAATPACDRASCLTGCCDSDGRCRRDDDPARCGTDGQQCAACLDGEACFAGTCSVFFQTPSECTVESCRGCCAGNRCVATPSEAYCGGDARECAFCAQWEACVAGACVLDESRCGPHNCAGCCIDGITCLEERTFELCGAGGLVCENCPEGGYRDCVDGICVN